MRGNTGDVAVITGAASGFGRALAEQALAGVLAGEPHVVTPGDLAGPVAERQAEIDRALSRVGSTPAG